jgi:hypothetical protein
MEKTKRLAVSFHVKPPRVLESPRTGSPFLTGIFYPTIIIPEGSEISDEVLIHELVHLARRDCFWNILCSFGRAALPLQPLMRLLAHKIEEMSDYVCDDYVVTTQRSAMTYARQLVALAERFHPAACETAIGVGILSGKPSLVRRLERLLSDSREIFITVSTRSRIKTGFFCILATVLTGFVGISATAIHSSHAQALVAAIDKHWLFDIVTPFDILPAIQTEVPDNLPMVIEKASTGTTAKKVFTSSETISSNFPVENDARETTNVPSSSTIKMTGIPDSEGGKSLETGVEQVPLLPKKEAAGKKINTAAVKDEETESALSGLLTNTATENPAAEMEDVRNCLVKGAALLESGDLASAEQYFLRALELESENPAVLNALGMTCFARKKTAQAKIFLKTAIACDKAYSFAYFNLGDVLFDEGKLNEAMASYKTAIELNPALKNRKRPFYIGDIVKITGQ